MRCVLQVRSPISIMVSETLSIILVGMIILKLVHVCPISGSINFGLMTWNSNTHDGGQMSTYWASKLLCI